MIAVIRLPGSSMNYADCGHQAPLVSAANELARSSKVVAFCCFVDGSLISGCASGSSGELDVRRSEDIRDCHVLDRRYTV